MDLDEKKSFRKVVDDDNGDGDMNSSSTSGSIELKKSCADCKTTKTPLWRAGPAGPKTLCNACGIRYRKTKGDHVLGFLKNPFKKRKRSPCTTSTSPTAIITSGNTSGGDGSKELKEMSLKMRVIVVGKSCMMFQRSKIVRKQRCQRRKKVLLLGEEEQQAAFSLMALSCGSVFA